MTPARTKFVTVDEYIAEFPSETQKKLVQLRKTIKEAAPDAEELISYGMPFYRQNGRLIYFAAHKNHIGIYPMITGVEEFNSRLSSYKWAKGSIQFPYDKPIPFDLISEIVKFRVRENLGKGNAKTKPKAKLDS
jgi:uncharacterized protein YdhG (YjbR/CyaY superfamily)